MLFEKQQPPASPLTSELVRVTSTSLSQLLDISPDALVVVDQAGYLVMVNQQAEALFAYERSELVGQPLEVLLPERFRAFHTTHREHYFSAPRTRSMGAGLQLFGKRKDDTEFPVDISLRSILLDEELSAIGAVRDVTEQKRMEEELAKHGEVESVVVSSRDIMESKQAADTLHRLASIVESSGEAIFSKTLEGVITSWNHGAETLFGYRAEEFIGQSVLLLFPPDHQQELDHILARIRLGHTLKNYEATRVRKDGTQVAISVTISPIPDQQGRIIGASTIVHDITEHKRMESEVLARQQLEAELAEQRRAEDTLRQSLEELASLNEALEKANLVRSHFLATMSHELRTPLASIVGFSEMLLEDAVEAGLNQQQRDNLVRVLINAEHLLDLINDVLDLSKIEAGRMEVNYSQVHVKELLTSVSEEILSLAMARDLVLRTEVEEGVDCLETNPTKLRQILLNLVSNALKFAEQGTVTLSARRVFFSDKGTEGVAFAVKDSGIGIAPNVQEHIFEAFYQADGSYTRKVGGTGLGLAIVSQLTALLGGTIAVESAPGQGSTFTVTLPLKAVHQNGAQDLPRLHPVQPQGALMMPPTAHEFVSATLEERLEGAVQPEATDGQHYLVLAVEDNADVITLIKAALRGTHYTVVSVQDPLKAMELVQELHPGAITLDVMMPRLNGWQLLHQLKDNPATASIPVIMLSVLADQATGYVLGADEYVIKPFKKEALRNALEHVIQLKKGPSQASERETQPVEK